jgi:hypothetical protein
LFKDSKSDFIWFDDELKPLYINIYGSSDVKNFTEFSNFIYMMKKIADIGWDNFVFDILE